MLHHDISQRADTAAQDDDAPHRCRCPQVTNEAARSRAPSPPAAGAARRSGPLPGACNIARNAGLVATSAQLVLITHPFHPFSGRQLVCVGERYNRSGKRLLLRIDDKSFCSVPPKWTDMSEPDPEVTMGQERALFTVADLMELACLVTRLSSHRQADSDN